MGAIRRSETKETDLCQDWNVVLGLLHHVSKIAYFTIIVYYACRALSHSDCSRQDHWSKWDEVGHVNSEATSVFSGRENVLGGLENKERKRIVMYFGGEVHCNRFFDTFLNTDLGNSHAASIFYNLSAGCVPPVMLISINQTRTESSVHGRLLVGAPWKISFVIITCNFVCHSRQLHIQTILQQYCYFKC